MVDKQFLEVEHDLHILTTGTNGYEREVTGFLIGCNDEYGHGKEFAEMYLEFYNIEDSQFSDHLREFDVDDGYFNFCSSLNAFDSKGRYLGNNGVLITFHDFPDDLKEILTERILTFNSQKPLGRARIKGYELIQRTKVVEEAIVTKLELK
jgi:hypothetical protein